MNEPICCIEGCTRVATKRARSVCNPHYSQLHWRGLLDSLPRVPVPTFEDRMAQYTPSGLSDDECWPWLGQRNRDGYGRIKRNGVTLVAHRAAYEMAFGQIPEGLFVRHSCDNPPCVNVRHLSLGTQVDNMRDLAVRERGPRKLSYAQVIEIRSAAPGSSITQLAKEYGVSRTHLSTIISGKKRTIVPARAAQTKP